MDLGTDVSSGLWLLRQQSDSLCTDACTVTRVDPDAEGVWDPVTGETSSPSLTVHVGLPCRLREPSASDRATIAGEHQFQQGDAILRLSAIYHVKVYADQGVVSGPLRIGDTVTVSSAQGVGMADTFTVVWPVSGSHMSSARFVVRKVL